MLREFFYRLPFSTSLEKKRGTAAGGGRIFTEIFSFCFRFHEIIPQSAYGCQLPFQGSLFSTPFLPFSPANASPIRPTHCQEHHKSRQHDYSQHQHRREHRGAASGCLLLGGIRQRLAAFVQQPEQHAHDRKRQYRHTKRQDSHIGDFLRQLLL